MLLLAREGATSCNFLKGIRYSDVPFLSTGETKAMSRKLNKEED